MDALSTVTIERLLVWCYQDQQADTMANRGIWMPAGGKDSSVAVMDRLSVGCAVDCSGSVMYDAGHLHPDADLAHAVVRTLPGRQIGLVIMHAKGGTRPDWMPGAQPRPIMVKRHNGKPVMVYADKERRNPAWCLLDYDPTPAHLAFMRGVWTVWWDALAILVTRLEGRLTRPVTMIKDQREPWLYERA